MKGQSFFSTAGPSCRPSPTAPHVEYGYDRVSNRTFRKNSVDPHSFRQFDEHYSYDGLHPLKEAQRGELNGTNTAIANLDFAQCWTLDETGNAAENTELNIG